KLSAIGGANTAWSIASFVLVERFGGSRHAVSFPMTAKDVRSGWLASASTTLTAKGPRLGSPSAMRSSISLRRLPVLALIPTTILQGPCSYPKLVPRFSACLRALLRSRARTGGRSSSQTTFRGWALNVGKLSENGNLNLLASFALFGLTARRSGSKQEP